MINHTKTTATDHQRNHTHRKSIDHWIYGVLVCLMLMTFFFGMRKTTLSLDDAYITYRYAQNIASGRGFVYNEGESVLGTTTPLYALLLAALTTIWPNIPFLSHYIGVIAWLLSVPIIYRIGKTRSSVQPGLIAAAMLASCGLFAMVLGMETTFYILLILTTAYLYILDHPNLAAVAAGLVFVARWDGVLIVGAFLFAEFLKRGKRVWQPVLITALITGAWLAYSQITFGSIFPNTFFAKVGQGHKANLGGTEFGTFTRGIVTLATALYAAHPLFLSVGVLAAIGVFAATIKRDKWWPLALWTISYVAGYTVLGVMNYGWYYPPLIPLLALLVGSGASSLVDIAGTAILALNIPTKHNCRDVSTQQQTPTPTRATTDLIAERTWLRWAKSCLLVGITSLVLVPNLRWLYEFSSPTPAVHMQTYTDTGLWLAQNTPVHASVALLEIGAIGYYSERTVVDAMGLVSPHMIGHLEDWLQVLLYAVNSRWPNYAVALNNTAWEAVVQQPWFEEMYHFRAQILNPADGVSPVDIYELRDGFPIHDFAIDTTTDMTFDTTIKLQRIQIAEANLNQGDPLHVQLTWNAQADITEYYRVGFDLINLEDGKRWILGDGFTPLNGGNPTTQWKSGDVVVDFYSLPIWGEIPPGDYILSPRVSSSDGSPAMATQETVAHSTHSIGIGQTQARMPANATFEDNLSLTGYDLRYDMTTDEFTVTLYWYASSAVTRNYTVFVHLINSDGQLILQDDSRPRRPTQIWQKGTRELDAHRFLVKDQNLAEPFNILVGLYPWPDLERLPIIEASGLEAADNALVLGTFTIDKTTGDVATVVTAAP